MEGVVLGLPLGHLVGLLIALPLIGSVLNGVIAISCRGGSREVPTGLVSVVGCLFPFAAFALTLFLASANWNPIEGVTTVPLWSWFAVGDLTVPVSFKVDRLSLVMALVVTGVGSLIHLYSVGYMKGDRGYARYFSYLNLFLFSMLTLVLAGNLPLLFVGWEGVGLCSYLLIGFWFHEGEKANAGMKAFIVNRIGDLGFLLGMFLLYATLSKRGVTSGLSLLSFDLLQQYRLEFSSVATLACLLLFAGAIGKSAQIPLYVWLPDAMAGPTPVSALIHAATMVTAGVYMIARMHFLYTLSPLAMEVVATVGAATALFAAAIATVQGDIKKVLAYSTISQLGYMFLAVGVGAFSAGIFHLVTHAFFKACLFLGAGSVIHAMAGEQEIWKMGGLRKKMPVTFFTFLVGVIAIVGVFPFAGFFSKDQILWQTFAAGHRVLWGVGFVTAGLTAFYMCRLLTVVFLGRHRIDADVHPHESPITMGIPLILLGLLSLVGGWIKVPEALSFGRPEPTGHGLELLLTIVSLLWVFHVGLLTTILYSQRPELIRRIASRLTTVRSLLRDKFYVDQVYNALVIRPLNRFSMILWLFSDEKVIDGLLVNGSAAGVGLIGRTVTLLQTGVVQTYAVFLAIGSLAVIAYFLL